MNENTEEKLLDLLSKKAVYGLSEEEQKELDALLHEFEGDDLDGSFDLAAAAISMIDLKTTEPLPDHLRRKILADAGRIFDAPVETPRQVVYAEPKRPFRDLSWLGWAAAAAACIALAAVILMPRVPRTVYVNVPEIKEQLTPAQMRQRLMDTSTDVIKANWGPGNVKELKDISGDIVWSDSKQAGYMRFRGLPINEKDKQTYQLWIFDETQDEKTPIDGGTFDIQDNGDVIIPINAKLKAVHPKMFAVTVEKPGGVVVSKREKIPALAKVET
jgi:hypothetical protein